MSRFKLPQVTIPLGAGFKLNSTTGLYDVDASAPVVATTAPASTQMLMSADGTLAYSMTLLATTLTPLVSGGSSSATIPTDGTLSGLPTTIVAGHSLSAASYVSTTGTAPYLVLWNVAAAAEEGSRWLPNIMPGSTLSLLIPQTANIYTVRGFAAGSYGGAATYESAQFSVTVASGILPATPTQTADSGATTTSVTMNWTSTAANYQVLTRNGLGSAYGSLSSAMVSTNSYTFTGLPSGASPRAVVIPQNIYGSGLPSAPFLSSLGSSSATPTPTTPASGSPYTARSSSHGDIPTSISVPSGSFIGLNFYAQIVASDGTGPGQAGFAICSSATTGPVYGQGDIGVNNSDFQHSQAADSRFTPPTYYGGMNIFQNGHTSGTSRTVYIWALLQDSSGNNLSSGPVVVTNADGSPFALTVNYQ